MPSEETVRSSGIDPSEVMDEPGDRREVVEVEVVVLLLERPLKTDRRFGLFT
jgi:hypothetical protein